MSFGKRNSTQEPTRHRKPPTNQLPPPAADEALYHAKLAGIAAMHALPELPWARIRRWTVGTAALAGVLTVLGAIGYRHVRAKAASTGLPAAVEALHRACNKANGELVAEPQMDCAGLFNQHVADRISYAYYWLHMAGIDAIANERRAFEAARDAVQVRERKLAASTTPPLEVPVRKATRALEPDFKIQDMCRSKWLNNYTMEDFCIKQQYEARSWVRARAIEERIAVHCADRWSTNWSMFQFCVKQEEQARDRIAR